MRIRLTPKLCYLIGMWKHRRTNEGIGFAGSEECAASFAASLVECNIATADKIQVEGKKVFTYHSAYRAFFDGINARQDEILRHDNEYSASFFAGMFDATGGIRNGMPFLATTNKADEIVLLRLNFKAMRAGKILFVTPADKFLSWIRPFRKVVVPDELNPGKLTARSARRKIERRRRVYPAPPPKEGIIP